MVHPTTPAKFKPTEKNVQTGTKRHLVSSTTSSENPPVVSADLVISHNYPVNGSSMMLDGVHIRFTDTCPVDNWLAFLRVIYLTNRAVYAKLVSVSSGVMGQRMVDVLNCVACKDYPKAKYEISRMMYIEIEDGKLDLYGDENAMRKMMGMWCYHETKSQCSNAKCPEKVQNHYLTTFPMLSSSCTNEWTAGQEISDWITEELSNTCMRELTHYQDGDDAKWEDSTEKDPSTG